MIGALGAMLIVPAAASAATQRYASPSGVDTAPCTLAAPCDIATAITGAGSGDDVYLIANQGNYSLSGGISSPSGKTVHIHGFDGRPNLLFPSGGGLSLEDGTADTLVIGAQGGATAFSLDTSNASADRIFVAQAGTGHPCYSNGGTLTNSICWQGNTASNDLAIETDGANTFRNDVAWNSGSGVGIRAFGRSGLNGNDTLINTIVRATGSGDHDLAANSTGLESATFNVSYSNFGTTVAEGTASTDHFNTDSTDQSAMPQLVNPSLGNFHERQSSPTINAGITSSANGSLDLDGNPRTVGGKTDIGAYELGTPSTSLPPTPSPPHGTTITKSKIKKKKHSARFSFKASGTVTGFQCALAKQKKGKHGKKKKKVKLVFRSCASPKTYKHLKHGRYIFEVRAVNGAGVDPKPAVRKFKI